jgi:hypothetical protein
MTSDTLMQAMQAIALSIVTLLIGWPFLRLIPIVAKIVYQFIRKTFGR